MFISGEGRKIDGLAWSQVEEKRNVAPIFYSRSVWMYERKADQPTDTHMKKWPENGTWISELDLNILSNTFKKWSKGKQKEVTNMVLFGKANFDKLLSKAPKFKFKLQREAATVNKLLSLIYMLVEYCWRLFKMFGASS
ncbi:hypothetical protein Tco_1046179 [Tanacetum coccineum]